MQSLTAFDRQRLSPRAERGGRASVRRAPPFMPQESARLGRRRQQCSDFELDPPVYCLLAETRNFVVLDTPIPTVGSHSANRLASAAGDPAEFQCVLPAMDRQLRAAIALDCALKRRTGLSPRAATVPALCLLCRPSTSAACSLGLSSFAYVSRGVPSPALSLFRFLTAERPKRATSPSYLPEGAASPPQLVERTVLHL